MDCAEGMYLKRTMENESPLAIKRASKGSVYFILNKNETFDEDMGNRYLSKFHEIECFLR